MKKIAGIILGAALAATTAKADLVAGDITIIGFRSDANDGVSFVTWKNIDAGTSLYFSDSGFFSDGTVRSSENIMSWTAPVAGLAAGSVVVITCPNGSSSANVGTTVGRLDNIAADGDQIFIGTGAFPNGIDTSKPGEAYSGMLLYGINFDGSTWASDATSSNTSDLPSALDGLHLNQAIAEVDNGQYTGPRTGLTVNEYKLAIHNSANWTFNNDGAVAFGALNATSFVIPEPATMGLIGLFGGGLLVARRLFSMG